MTTDVQKLNDAKHQISFELTSIRTALSTVEDNVNGIGLDMFPERARVLDEHEWKALQKAESKLLTEAPPYGPYGYTDVFSREDSHVAGMLWDYTQPNVENIPYTSEQPHPDNWIEAQTARRVARALLLCVSGEEALLR
jgi:hypothetical protein